MYKIVPCEVFWTYALCLGLASKNLGGYVSCLGLASKRWVHASSSASKFFETNASCLGLASKSSAFVLALASAVDAEATTLVHMI